MKQTLSSLKSLLFCLTLTGLAAAPATAQQPQPPSEATLPLAAAQYKISRLATGVASDEAAFPLDAAGVVRVEIMATVGGIGTSILGPGGQTINPNNVEALGGAFTATDNATIPSGPSIFTSLSRAFHYVYTFPTQGSGVYTVRFSAPAGLSEEVPILTEVTTDSPVVAKLFAVSPSLLSGRPAVLSAALFNGQTPVAGANVEVTVNREGGPATTLTLHDDANPADAAAGDGLYSGEFTPSQPGAYSALAVITGTSAGGAFTRHSLTEFRVVAAPSRLTGAAPDNGFDDNGDGLIERVSFNVGTQTTTAGAYRAFVHLKTAAGKRLVASGEAELFAGPGTVAVDFLAADLRETGEGGPYTVTMLELDVVNPEGETTIDRRDLTAQTQGYLFTRFQRAPLLLTGVTTDNGVDLNGNGQYDRLNVTVQIDALVAGFYRWNLKLTDQNSNRIDFARGQGFLSAGLNNLPLVYNGSLIGSSGAHGPFRLEDMLLFGPRAAIFTGVGQTRAYRSIEFENGHEETGDAVAPTVSASLSTPANAAGWHNANVIVTFNASDNQGGSGVQSITYSASGAQPTAATTVNGSSVALAVSAEGTTVITYFARDNAGNTGAPQTLTVKLDKTAPAINVSSPMGALLLNQAATAAYTCSDGASGVTACAGSLPVGGTVDTSAVGPRQFTVTATDAAGNTAVQTINYTVSYGVRFNYDPDKAHNSGSTVPIKLELVDANGVNVSNQSIVVHALETLLASNYAPGEVEDAGNANPDDNFRFSGGGYILNLKTTGLTTGTYVLTFRAGADPLTHGAQFQIR